MPRRPGVQLRRRNRTDGTITYTLRVRVGRGDHAIMLGNTADGWDEARAERARQQVLAKIELGLWRPGEASITDTEEEPTFAELATEWLDDRERNPAIRPRTTEDDRWRLIRYLIPHFGEMLPSQITPLSIKQYRRHIHQENEHIRVARRAGTPLQDSRTGQPLRPLSNDSINKTLRTLALILDEAEDAGWVARNVARGRRTREPVERQRRDALEPDELVSMLDAASQLDFAPHKPRTLERANEVRALRDGAGLEWKEIARRLEVPPSTAAYLYGCEPQEAQVVGPRRAVIATLALTGLRVSELCALERHDVDVARARISVRDAKTDAGVRTVDIRPRLLTELTAYREAQAGAVIDAPAFPTAAGTRRDRNNVSGRVITPVVKRANELRAKRDQPPITIAVTPHTFRRTYITFMLAAGFDVPYVQDQVGHTDPITTLGIYARVIRRADRDKLRDELRELFGERQPAVAELTPRGAELQARWRGPERFEREGLER